MNRILFLIIFAFQLSQAQNIESKIKIACQCKPMAYYPKIVNNTLYFTTLEKKEYSENLFLYIYEKIGQRWNKSSKFKVDDNADAYNLESNTTEILINQTKYFYSIYSMKNMGTAYSGRKKYMFVFQEVNALQKPIIVYFEKWIGDNGNYQIKGQKNIVSYKVFLNKCSEFVDKTLSSINQNIDNPENFSLRWNLENSSVYELINNNNEKDIDLNFIEFSGNSFYNDNKNQNSTELKTSKYLVLGGYVSPILVYNISLKKSQVVFIPEGWPNGGGWGFRSYLLKTINGDILTVESEGNYLKIDLAKQIFNVIKK